MDLPFVEPMMNKLPTLLLNLFLVILFTACSPVKYVSNDEHLLDRYKIKVTEGKVKKAVVHEFSPVDVKNIRAKVGMSQNEFASAFGISVSTLRHWERGDRTPQGPALVLLNVVAKEPEVVLRALAS